MEHYWTRDWGDNSAYIYYMRRQKLKHSFKFNFFFFLITTNENKKKDQTLK